MNITKAFSYLLAANMEAAILLVGGWLIGEWLNDHYPRDFSWMLVTFLVAGIIIMHSWYVIFKTLLRLEAAHKVNKKAESSSSK